MFNVLNRPFWIGFIERVPINNSHIRLFLPFYYRTKQLWPAIRQYYARLLLYLCHTASYQHNYPFLNEKPLNNLAYLHLQSEIANLERGEEDANDVRPIWRTVYNWVVCISTRNAGVESRGYKILSLNMMTLYNCTYGAHMYIVNCTLCTCVY